SSNHSYFTDADSAPIVFTIKPAPLVIAVDSTSRVYGQPNPPFTGTVTGILNQEDVAVVYATTATQSSDVLPGGYPITVAGLTGAKAGNYSFDPGVAFGASVTNGTLIINAAPLIVTANDLAKITGEVNPTFTVRYDGFVLGQGPEVLGGSLTF